MWRVGLVAGAGWWMSPHPALAAEGALTLGMGGVAVGVAMGTLLGWWLARRRGPRGDTGPAVTYRLRHDAEGRERTLTWVSPAVEALTGRPVTWWRANGLVAALHPEDRAALEARWPDLLAAGGGSQTHRVQAADGTWVEVVDAFHLVSVADGYERRGVLAPLGGRETPAAVDAASHEIYEQMFTVNRAPKLLIDADDGRIVDANPAALGFYGYTAAAIREKRIQDINMLLPPAVRAEMDRARREERLYFEFRHRLANGEIRDVQVYSGPVRLRGHTYLHSIIHDVTESRQYQARLEDYKHLFDVLPVGIYRNTAGPDGRFLDVNPAMVSIFEAEDTEELLATPVRDLYYAPETRNNVSMTLLAEESVRHLELPLKTLRGRPLWVAVTAQRHEDADGTPVFDGLLEDISERKATEQALIHTHLFSQALQRLLQGLVTDTPPPRTLYDMACSLMVEEGGLAAAWVAEGPADAPPTLLAQAGLSPAQATALRNAPLDPADTGGGSLARQAQARGQVEVVQQVTGKVADTPWGRQAAGHGFAAAAALPLRRSHGVVGVLEVYSFTPGHFSAALLGLLGQTAAAIGFGLDAHAHKIERDQLISILEATPDPVGMIDPEGRPLYHNRAAQTLFGLPAGTSPDHNVRDFHPPTESEYLLLTVLPRARETGVWQGENRIRTQDGEARDVIQVVLAHKDDQGQVVRYSTIVHDITPLKQSQARVRQHEAVLGDMARNIPGAIFQFRQDPDGQYHIPYMSAGFETLTGITAAEAMADAGRALNATLPEDLPIVLHSIEISARTLEPWYCEYRTRMNGQVRWIRGASQPRREEDGSILWNGVLLDITDAKAVEAELAQTNGALRRSNEELERFAYAASHDLQEPLRMVANYTALLERRYGDRLDERGRQFVTFAVDGAQRMARMIQDLLEYSRVTTRGDPFRTVDTAAALTDALANLGKRLHDEHAQVEVGLMPPVHGDRGQIVRLFQNLVGNALKYRHPDRVPQVTVWAEPGAAPGWWRFTVADNGIGIAEADYERVFQVFQRVAATADRQDGTGIGLALVKRTVERHGGTVWVESMEGEGSRFQFTLPEA